MDEQMIHHVSVALRAATDQIEPSPDLDTRVRAIVSARERRRRRPLAIAAIGAAVLAIAGVATIVATDGEEGTGRVVTAGPDHANEARWAESTPLPLGARREPTIVWTGREAIVWGGIPDPPQGGDGGDLASADGARLDLATDAWRRLAGAPLAGRYGHVAVWTGTEMIVWGGVVNPSGRAADGTSPNDGAAYDPAMDRWRRIAPSPLAPPSATSLGSGQQAVWAGTEMLVWATNTDRGGAGAAYDPSADSWRLLPPLPGRPGAPRSLVWTGEVVLAFPRSTSAARPGSTVPGGPAGPSGPGQFGVPVVSYEADIFDPKEGSWRALPPSQLSPGIGTARATWTGRDFVVVGAQLAGQDLSPGMRASARYRPTDDAWYAIAPLPFAGPFSAVVQEWTGDEVLVVGLRQAVQEGSVLVAAAYSPRDDRWRTVPVPSRFSDTARAVEGGGKALIWSRDRVLIYG